jgi:plastocyanin
LDAALDYGLAAMTGAIECITRRSCGRASLGLLSLLGCLLVSPSASAQHVRGKLEGYRLLQNPVWLDARDPKRHGYSFREPVPTVRAEFRRMYPHIPKEICVVALAATPQKPPATAVLVRVGGGRTTPVTMVVAPGTKLTFQNTDPFKHRLYAVGLKTFTASDTLQGATREWTVPEAGAFEIRDESAPSLRMWVVAEPTVAAIAYPSLKGEFAVPLEAPGDYRIQAFFSGKRVGPEVPVTVAAADFDIKTPLRLVSEKQAAKAAKDDAEGGEGSKAPAADASADAAKQEGAEQKAAPDASAEPPADKKPEPAPEQK